MTRKKVSFQQVLLIAVFIAEPESWFTARDIEHKTGISGNTVRQHCLKFCKIGLLDRVEVFPGNKYRLALEAHSQPYFKQILDAAVALGVMTRSGKSASASPPSPEFKQILDAAAAIKLSLGLSPTAQ